MPTEVVAGILCQQAGFLLRPLNSTKFISITILRNFVHMHKNNFVQAHIVIRIFKVFDERTDVNL